MKLILHDTLTLLEPLFCEPSRPDERLEKARPILYGADGLFGRFKLVQRAQRTALFETMQAGAVDGYQGCSQPQERRERRIPDIGNIADHPW